MTTVEQVKSMMDGYIKWLSEGFSLRFVDSGRWVEVTTPMLDRHNDHIQIYIKKTENGWVLTDDSFTLDDLAMSGCDITSDRRKLLLSQTINGLGVELNENNALVVTSSNADFARKKHFLLQAILAVNDLFYLAKPNVEKFFFEDVSDWLDRHDIRNSSRIMVMGKSHFSHQFDFLIPKSKNAGDRFLKLVNRPTKSNIKAAMFSWIDTREMRDSMSQGYVVVNDYEAKDLEEEKEALLAYGANMIPWSQKDSFLDQLAA